MNRNLEVTKPEVRNLQGNWENSEVRKMEELENQLIICLKSYQDVCELIKDQVTPSLLETRKNLLTMIFNIHFYMNPLGNLLIGSICSAPRYTEGIMDLALILSKIEEVCVVCWIYPRNYYELSSSGIRMDIERLQPFSEEMNFERIKRLQNLSYSDSVLVQNSRGIFIHGQITKRTTPGLSRTDQNLLEIVCENPINSKVTVHTVPEDILSVVPSSATQVQIKPCPEIDEDIQSNSMNEFRTSQEGNWSHSHQVMLIGDWERHTKGIGSRLMAKMGYKRFLERLPFLIFSVEKDSENLGKAELILLMCRNHFFRLIFLGTILISERDYL